MSATHPHKLGDECSLASARQQSVHDMSENANERIPHRLDDDSVLTFSAVGQVDCGFRARLQFLQTDDAQIEA